MSTTLADIKDRLDQDYTLEVVKSLGHIQVVLDGGSDREKYARFNVQDDDIWKLALCFRRLEEELLAGDVAEGKTWPAQERGG